jgi:hypothetical protein
MPALSERPAFPGSKQPLSYSKSRMSFRGYPKSMNRRSLIRTACAGLTSVVASRLFAAEKYSGPRVPKKDVLYLVHGDNLIATEVAVAQQSSAKDSEVFSVPGASSPVRTPLAEPIFMLAADQISPDSLGLYRFDVRNGQREIVLTGKKKKAANRQYHLSLRTYEGGLYRVEAAEALEAGEYSISPEGSNTSFCFSVY